MPASSFPSAEKVLGTGPLGDSGLIHVSSFQFDFYDAGAVRVPSVGRDGPVPDDQHEPGDPSSDSVSASQKTCLRSVMLGDAGTPCGCECHSPT